MGIFLGTCNEIQYFDDKDVLTTHKDLSITDPILDGTYQEFLFFGQGSGVGFAIKGNKLYTILQIEKNTNRKVPQSAVKDWDIVEDNKDGYWLIVLKSKKWIEVNAIDDVKSNIDKVLNFEHPFA